MTCNSPGDIDTCAATTRRHTAACERRTTPRHATLRFLALAIATLAACGGDRRSKRGDTYAAATSTQEACCEHLVAGAREGCLQEIVRVNDEAVARSDANQDTYECVQEHFACDPGTGRATPPSAQAQLDCIQDLP